jgi:hypothetical protein
MPSRKPRWAVYELRDDKFNPVSHSYEDVGEAEEKLEELRGKKEFQGKRLFVRTASYPVDPRKPVRRR